MENRPAFVLATACLAACQSAVIGAQPTSEARGAPPERAAPAAVSEAELALELENPLAPLLSVPIQIDWDTGFGPEDADRLTFSLQPVLPLSIGEDWNLISRTVVPYVEAEPPVGDGGIQSGLGNIEERLFFSPKRPTASGWIWGAGPAMVLASSTTARIAEEEWAVGPTGAIVKQEDGWTYGALASHLWSFEDADARSEVGVTHLEPFVSYTSPDRTTVGLESESSYDWEIEYWTIPFDLTATQLVVLGGQPMRLGLGLRQYAEGPPNGPHWGLRFIWTLIPR